MMAGGELFGVSLPDSMRSLTQEERRGVYINVINYGMRRLVVLFNNLCFNPPGEFRLSDHGLIGTISGVEPGSGYDIVFALQDSDYDMTIHYDTRTETIVSVYIYRGIHTPDLRLSGIDQLDTQELALYSHSIQAFLDAFDEYTMIRRDLKAEIMIWRDKLVDIIEESRIDLYCNDDAFEFPFSEELADRLMKVIYDAFDSSYQEMFNPLMSRYDEPFYAKLKAYLKYEFEMIRITPNHLLLFTLYSMRRSIYTSPRN